MGCLSHWKTLFIDNSNTVQDFGSSVLSLLWILFQVDCLYPLHLVIFVGFYFAPSTATYLSIISFCLTYCFCVWSPFCRLHDCSSFRFCPLVDEVVPVARADFLVRRRCLLSGGWSWVWSFQWTWPVRQCVMEQLWVSYDFSQPVWWWVCLYSCRSSCLL